MALARQSTIPFTSDPPELLDEAALRSDAKLVSEPARRPIEVCLTVDTEFSIGGAFTFPAARTPVGRPAVDCIIGGTSHGLEFLLKTLRRYGMDATFFLEALQTSYFGDQPMSEVARSIAAAGHDVELHLHPEWRTFEQPNWEATLAAGRPNDACSGRSLDDMCEIIAMGQKVFDRWGMAPPVALRTGSFKVDRNVYDAMHRMGLYLGSNIGAAITPPDDESLHLHGGLHRIGEVVELPALTYHENLRLIGPRARILSIASTSSWEARALLQAAYRKQISPVVILTHPFEFIKRRDAQFRQIAPNNLTQKRLASLCEYIVSNPSAYSPVTFSGRASEWRERRATINPNFTVGFSAAVLRSAQNLVNDFIWHL